MREGCGEGQDHGSLRYDDEENAIKYFVSYHCFLRSDCMPA